jgi:hypothetical protein
LSDTEKYFSNTISNDLFALVAGKIVDIGSTREVFRDSRDTNHVLKFETGAQRFQNVMEWETWQVVKWTPQKFWFAPCADISPNGSILVMKYCRDMEDDELPEELPAFFADIKRSNFGIYDGHVVARDYGNSYLIDRGLTRKMRKVEW